MSKHIVVYYSKTGSNKYLAEKTAKTLDADIVQIQPRVTPFLFQLLASSTGISWGNKKINIDFSQYSSVILCGPIWMGTLIAPLNDFINKKGKDIDILHFMTCCGSKDLNKEDKFGYAHVFRKVRDLMGNKSREFMAFPIELVLPEDKKEDDQAMMNTRLNDQNFIGTVEKRFNDYIERIIAS